jgi:hypothetical protein
MSAIISLSIDVTKIDKSKLVKDKYLNLDVIVNDETNNFGQNVSASYSQSKEERERKVSKVYLGNGKVNWTNGQIVKAEPVATNQTQQRGRIEETSDLPF